MHAFERRPFGRVTEVARPWTTTSSLYGSFDPTATRASPLSLSISPSRHFLDPPRTEAEGIGSFYASFKPLAKPRPASDCTIQMRNQAIRDGLLSSEAIGGHTGAWGPDTSLKPQTLALGSFPLAHGSHAHP